MKAFLALLLLVSSAVATCTVTYDLSTFSAVCDGVELNLSSLGQESPVFNGTASSSTYGEGYVTGLHLDGEIQTGTVQWDSGQQSVFFSEPTTGTKLVHLGKHKSTRAVMVAHDLSLTTLDCTNAVVSVTAAPSSTVGDYIAVFRSVAVNTAPGCGSTGNFDGFVFAQTLSTNAAPESLTFTLTGLAGGDDFIFCYYTINSFTVSATATVLVSCPTGIAAVISFTETAVANQIVRPVGAVGAADGFGYTPYVWINADAGITAAANSFVSGTSIGLGTSAQNPGFTAPTVLTGNSGLTFTAASDVGFSIPIATSPRVYLIQASVGSVSVVTAGDVQASMVPYVDIFVAQTLTPFNNPTAFIGTNTASIVGLRPGTSGTTTLTTTTNAAISNISFFYAKKFNGGSDHSNRDGGDFCQSSACATAFDLPIVIEVTRLS